MAEVKIKLFANLREAAGTPELLLSGEKVIDVLLSLTDKHPGLKSLIFEKSDEKVMKKVRARFFAVQLMSWSTETMSGTWKGLILSLRTRMKLEFYLLFQEADFFRGEDMGRIFKERTSVDEALRLFLESISPLRHTEEVPLEACAGRVLAEAVVSGRDVPHYRRAAMDGYAVRASDTPGASPANPVLLQLSDSVEEGTSMWVHTGAALPEGADAVVMVEDTVTVGDMVEIRAQVYPGRNVGQVGEDIKKRRPGF